MWPVSSASALRIRVASPTRRLSTRSREGGTVPPAGAGWALSLPGSGGVCPISVSKDRTQSLRQGLQIDRLGTTRKGPELELPLGEARCRRWRSVARLRDNAETASLSAEIDPAPGQGRHILPLSYSRGSCSTGGASYRRNPTRTQATQSLLRSQVETIC